MPKMHSDYTTSINFPCTQELKDNVNALALSLQTGAQADIARRAMSIGVEALIEKMTPSEKAKHAEVLANVQKAAALKRQIAKDAVTTPSTPTP